MGVHSITTIGTVTIDGRAVTGSQQKVVSVLALWRSSGATIDTLIDAAWPDQAPATARKSIQNQIVRLRREFGSAIITTSGNRYWLNAATDVDAIDAVTPLCSNDALTPSEQTRIANVLSAWRGDAYVSLDDHPLAEAERARLAHVKGRLVETLAVSRLADPAGNIEATIIDLTVRTSTDPLHEQAWELLIAALHLSGRRTEALTTAARFGTVLESQLGAQPSRRFKALHRRVRMDLPIDPAAVLASPPVPLPLRATA